MRSAFYSFMLLAIYSTAQAQAVYTVTTTADAFVATGSPSNPEGADLTGLNFGGAGALVVSPPGAVKGEFQSLLRFTLTGETNAFNAAFGTNNWTINSITLDLTSNNGTAGVQPNNGIFPVITGGNFVIEWLADDTWVEGTGNPNLTTTDGVTYDSLPDLLAGTRVTLCTNTYAPPGDNVHVVYPLPLNPQLVADAMGGGDVSFRLYAADTNINYLFNSYFFGRGNQPLIHVTATQLPPRLLPGSFTNGGFYLTGLGAANASFQVQASTNLATTNWQTLATVSADAGGSIQFNDTNAVNLGRRFYRLSTTGGQ